VLCMKFEPRTAATAALVVNCSAQVKDVVSFCMFGHVSLSLYTISSTALSLACHYDDLSPGLCAG
jgi:hypothetical protein